MRALLLGLLVAINMTLAVAVTWPWAQEKFMPWQPWQPWMAVTITIDTSAAQPTLTAVRTIIRDVPRAFWRAQVDAIGDNPRRACGGGGVGDYLIDEPSVLGPVTLGYWSNDPACDNLPPGRYVIRTWWWEPGDEDNRTHWIIGEAPEFVVRDESAALGSN